MINCLVPVPYCLYEIQPKFEAEVLTETKLGS